MPGYLSPEAPMPPTSHSRMGRIYYGGLTEDEIPRSMFLLMYPKEVDKKELKKSVRKVFDIKKRDTRALVEGLIFYTDVLKIDKKFLQNQLNRIEVEYKKNTT